MLHVNQDNDDLFKEAAAHYPLNTGNPDWEQVLKKMQESGDIQTKENKRSKRGLLWFIILPILLIPVSIFDISLVKTSGSAAASNRYSPAKQQETNAGINSSQPIASGTVHGKTSYDPNEPADAATSKQEAKDIVHKQKQHPGAGTTNNKQYTAKKTVIPVNKEETSVVSVEDDPQTVSRKTIPAISPVKTNTALNPAEAKDSVPHKFSANENPESKKTVANKTPKKKSSPQSHFYIGLMGGPDISTVKLQSAKKAGFNIGLLAGYHITRRWSAEAGLFWIQKKYATDGKYVDTKNMGSYANMSLESLDGDCHMMEMPLTIRYAFKEHGRSGWSVAAGMSAYFMKAESYAYNISYWGSTYPYFSKYPQKETDLFAAVNLSVGYTYKLGHIGDLRIEPYVKIPVKKIGTGSLPIQSAGINIGFTKTIF